MNYHLVLSELYSDKKWSITGNTYDGLKWKDDSVKPEDATLISQYSDALTIESNTKEIIKLKRKLLRTDYVALSDYDQDKTDVKAQRQEWREDIRSRQAIIDGIRGDV